MSLAKTCRTAVLLALTGVALTGCAVYEPAPYYAAAPDPYYGYYYAPAPAYAAPSFSFFGEFGGGRHRHYRGRRW